MAAGAAFDIVGREAEVRYTCEYTHALSQKPTFRAGRTAQTSVTPTVGGELAFAFRLTKLGQFAKVYDIDCFRSQPAVLGTYPCSVTPGAGTSNGRGLSLNKDSHRPSHLAASISKTSNSTSQLGLSIEHCFKFKQARIETLSKNRENIPFCIIHRRYD